MVCVFVLRMSLVPANPPRVELMSTSRVDRGPPQLEIEGRALLPLPTAGHPTAHPFAHTLYQILRVAGERATKANAFSRDCLERLDQAAQRHAIVRGRGLRDPIIPA